jgi:two-component system sensor histidine kinase MprB
VSLRVRLLLVVALTFACVVVGSVYAAHLSASSQLRSETDRFLRERSARFTSAPAGPYPQPSPDNDHKKDGDVALADYDTVTQVLDTRCNIVSSLAGQPQLPISKHDRVLAASHTRASSFDDVTVKGTPYRVLTVAFPTGGAVQIASNVSATNDILSSLDVRLLLIAVSGTVLVAGIAWLIARRTVRPVEDLTRAAEYVAETQDLAKPIPVSRNDELGRLAGSFNTMLEALDTSRTQQRRLVVDASHELRTPLTALRTNIELLQRAASLEEQQRSQLLSETGLELTELTDLVNELVELATDARADEPATRFELGGLVEQVVGRHRRRSGRTITLELRDPAFVDARSSMLDRAVSNLVDNALKFSPATTPVDVVVDGGRIEVLDRGPGVDDGDRARVFDRFYRADKARTMPGSGLGLAIVKQIVELDGGTVALAPRPGGGTVARIDLPAAEASGEPELPS